MGVSLAALSIIEKLPPLHVEAVEDYIAGLYRFTEVASREHRENSGRHGLSEGYCDSRKFPGGL